MKHLNMTDSLHEYIIEKGVKELPVQRSLRAHTAKMPMSRMQISPIQGQFMQFLVRMLQAKKILELGTFTGYSALTMSLALPDDGQLITCDINDEWTQIAKPYWEEAQQDHKIELKLGSALETLQKLIDEGHGQTFDLIFIDADKSNYLHYYELALKLIKPGGVILVDNVLWDGKVIDESETGSQTRTIRQLNDKIQSDNRVDSTLIPISDGLFMIRTKAA